MGFSGARAAMNRAQPLARTVTPLTTAQAAALARQPGTITQVAWPTDYKAAWQFTIAPPRGAPVTVAVDDARGTAALQPDMDRGEATTGRLMRRIHDGTGMGPVWQVIIFLGGLLPAALAVTGVIMWWRARGWRAELAARRAAVSSMA